ncbi:MAG: hypothetical protein M3478_11260, partial [Planctomycetota bacterium]|nr:hypothetical protein [Planctomycetota bacterium]
DRGSPLLWYLAMSWYVPPEKMPQTVVFLMDAPNDVEAEVLRGAENVWTVSEASAALPEGITAGRSRGHTTHGFNLPMMQQWISEGKIGNAEMQR